MNKDICNNTNSLDGDSLFSSKKYGIKERRLTEYRRCNCDFKCEKKSEFYLFNMETQSIISNQNCFTINSRLKVSVTRWLSQLQ